MEPLQPDDPSRVGPYQVIARLGAGGMGVVYLGRSRSGRRVAIKVMRKVSASDPAYRTRFRREIDAARKVTGTFTAAVLEADPDDAVPWLAVAYLPGLSLWDTVQDFGPLPAETVRALAAGLAEALAAIHRAGVVHRDLKPGNVILTADGPRVIDFGIARPENDATAFTQPGVPIGTPGFMSPEQTRGEEIGPASDVFALGATLCYAATGVEPFGTGAAESRHHRVLMGRPDLGTIVEPWLRELITDCLRAEPERRPSPVGVLARLGPSGEDGPSLRNTRWLPPEIAEEIDRRTAEAVRLPGRPVPVSPRPVGRPGANDEVTDVGFAEPPGDMPRPDPQGTRALSRRTLIAGAGVGILAGGGIGALMWPGKPKSRWKPRPVARSGSPTVAFPRPTARWKRPTGADYMELTVTDDVLLARTDTTVRAFDPRTGRVL